MHGLLYYVRYLYKYKYDDTLCPISPFYIGTDLLKKTTQHTFYNKIDTADSLISDRKPKTAKRWQFEESVLNCMQALCCEVTI